MRIPPLVRFGVLSAFAVALAALPGPVLASGYLTTTATSGAGTTASVHWEWSQIPDSPADPAAWVGYDVLRRPAAPCGEFVRITPTPVLRMPGVSEAFTIQDALPASAALYQYRVVPVDAQRNALTLGWQVCDQCVWNAWVSGPDLSAPIVVGTLLDMGWALQVQPCGDGCYPLGYVDREWATTLRPYAGTGTVLAIYGTATCGTVEGCAFVVDHVAATACTVTPARASTWGRLKAAYR